MGVVTGQAAHVFVAGDRHLIPLLLLHKTGGDERELLPLAAEAAPGHPAVALRGEVVEDGKLRFFRRLGPGVFDEPDLRRRTEVLAAGLGGLLALHALARPVALGLSNGANMAAALTMASPAALAGAILLRPASPYARLPEVDLAGMPILIVAGLEDTTVLPAETGRLERHLRTCGALVTRHDVPAGHRITAREVPLIRSWLAAALPTRVPAGTSA